MSYDMASLYRASTTSSLPTNRHEIIDFGPGERHIFLRTAKRTYYVPEVFHLAPTFACDSNIPLLIRDVVKSRTPIDIYGSHGLQATSENIILINNHPIRRIRVVGKIVGEFYKDFDNVNRSNFIIVTLDDSSGYTLPIKIKEALYKLAGINFNHCYGTILEVTGYMHEFNERKELVAITAEIAGSREDIDVEIDFIRETLKFRNEVLMIPWVYDPPNLGQSIEGDVQVRYPREHYVQQNLRRNLTITDHQYVPPNFATDSVILNRQNILINRSSDPCSDPQSAILIDLTKSDGPEYEASSDEDLMIIEKSDEIKSMKTGPSKIVNEYTYKLELVKWIIDNGQPSFMLDEAYCNFKLVRLLNVLTKFEFARQSVSRVKDESSIIELKRYLFHKIRHDLQTDNLIKCSKSLSCHVANLLTFYRHVKKCLKTIIFSKIEKNQMVNLDCRNFIKLYQVRYGIGMEEHLLCDLIKWILMTKLQTTAWRLDELNLEWSFHGDASRGFEVINARNIGCQSK